MDVAFVDPTGEGVSCDLSSPCSSFEAALATEASYIKLTGTIIARDTVAITGRKLTVLADSGAVLTQDASGPVMKIDGASQVSIFDLTIAGAKNPRAAGIWMPAGNQSSVSLERVTVEDNARVGILIEDTGHLSILDSKIIGNHDGLLAKDCTISIRQSTISRNLWVGVGSNDSVVRVSQSTIENNGTGGLSMYRPSEFYVANNFIIRNGNESSSLDGFGGVYINIEPGTSTRKIEFNTIVDNRVKSTKPTGGVECYGGAFAPNNLVFGNSTGTEEKQTVGDCKYENSLLAAPDPVFRSATDYHLTAATPSSIRDAFDCTGGIDFDGDERPQGGKCDLGADEFRP